MIHENLAPEPKNTLSLQPEKKLWHIYINKEWIFATILDFSMFLYVYVILYTHYWSAMLNNVFIWILDREIIGLDPKSWSYMK